MYVYIMKQKNYTGAALFIPFSIALAASVFPLINTKLNSDIPQPVVNVGHVCDFSLCPSKGHNNSPINYKQNHGTEKKRQTRR